MKKIKTKQEFKDRLTEILSVNTNTSESAKEQIVEDLSNKLFRNEKKKGK